MNVELKELQVVFYDSEIVIYFPSWYNLTVKQLKIIASPDIKENHYGFANKNGLFYVFLSTNDSQSKKVQVLVEAPQIEHISPNFFNK